MGGGGGEEGYCAPVKSIYGDIFPREKTNTILTARSSRNWHQTLYFTGSRIKRDFRRAVFMVAFNVSNRADENV